MFLMNFRLLNIEVNVDKKIVTFEVALLALFLMFDLLLRDDIFGMFTLNLNIKNQI